MGKFVIPRVFPFSTNATNPTNHTKNQHVTAHVLPPSRRDRSTIPLEEGKNAV